MPAGPAIPVAMALLGKMGKPKPKQNNAQVGVKPPAAAAPVAKAAVKPPVKTAVSTRTTKTAMKKPVMKRPY